MPNPTRLFACALAALLLTLPSPASGQEGSGTFRDDDTSRFEPFIEAAAAAGLVRGCNPPANDRFCPNDPVTRGEMAALLVRALNLPAAAGRYFDDTEGHAGADAADSLAEAGLSSGCEPGLFCPNRHLSRGELAAFIYRAFWNGTSPLAYTHYRDVDTSEFGAALALLGTKGVLEACDPPVGRKLCPEMTVSRGEATYAVISAMGVGPAPLPGRLASLETTAELVSAYDIVGMWSNRQPSNRNRLSITGSGYRGDGLAVTIPRGSHYGADFRLDLSSAIGHDPEQLFFRYYLRLDPRWAPRDSGKLPGFSGMYSQAGKGGRRSSPSAPGWSARMQFFGTRPDDPRARLGYYVYHLGQERQYGDGMMWNEAGKLKPGEWYCIEGEVRMNTVGFSDGSLRAWVDETPAFERTGIAFRRPKEPSISIESFWFNVYYGGKPVAPERMGLVVDELTVDTARIGCGTGQGVTGSIEADLAGEGLPSLLWWGDCPGGTCFQAARTTVDGMDAPRRLGDTAWFSLETHRFGIYAADLTGDGRDDVIYRGRCGRSEKCWRVHRSSGTALGPGEDWGDGLRLDSGTTGFVIGDFDGDERDDVAYVGKCGTPGEICWRVHRSLGNGLAEPENWGVPDQTMSHMGAADVTGDGRDDLVYSAPCDDSTCWYARPSTGSGFGEANLLGPAREVELDFNRLVDMDGSGRADMVTAHTSPGGGTTVEVRTMARRGLGPATTLLQTAGPFEDLLVRSPRTGPPREALVVTSCEEQTMCVEGLAITAGVAHHPADLRSRAEALIEHLQID